MFSAIRAIPVMGSQRSAASRSMTSRVRLLGGSALASVSTLARLGSASSHDLNAYPALP